MLLILLLRRMPSSSSEKEASSDFGRIKWVSVTINLLSISPEEDIASVYGAANHSVLSSSPSSEKRVRSPSGSFLSRS